MIKFSVNSGHVTHLDQYLYTHTHTRTHAQHHNGLTHSHTKYTELTKCTAPIHRIVLYMLSITTLAYDVTVTYTVYLWSAFCTNAANMHMC